MNHITVEGQITRYDEKPDTCPQCHYGIDPTFIVATVAGDINTRDSLLQIAYKCTKKACGHLFIGTYAPMFQVTTFTLYSLTSTAPVRPMKRPFPEEVSNVSAQFVEIYNQSAVADATLLDQIAGVGYRKALEFLVKDYCVRQSPADVDLIRNKMLAQCIADHVADTNIKECARRAAWLGNDETHYVRKWEEKDIRDLKILIDLTVNWIRNEILTQRYLTEMK